MNLDLVVKARGGRLKEPPFDFDLSITITQMYHSIAYEFKLTGFINPYLPTGQFLAPKLIIILNV